MFGLGKVRILRKLTHPSVVAVQEVFSDSPDYVYVVLEYLLGGPVFDRIVKKVGGMSRLSVGPPSL